MEAPRSCELQSGTNGRPYGLPFLALLGNNGSNSVPRLDARLEDLKVPILINMTLVDSAERAWRELYGSNAMVEGVYCF